MKNAAISVGRALRRGQEFAALLFCIWVTGPALAAPFDLERVLLIPPEITCCWLDFGYSVAATSDQIFVGQRNRAVHVFDVQTGMLQRTIPNPDPLFGGSQFGWSLAVAGPNLLVGASGATYVVDPKSGNILHTLPNSGHFPHTLAAMGNRLFVGNPQLSNGTVPAGAVQEYDAVSGALARTIANPNPNALPSDGYDYFGQSVAVDRERLLVGAPGENTDESKGTAYLFDSETLTVLRTFKNPEPQPGQDWFGGKVAMSGNQVFVARATPNGAVYMFDM